MKSRKQEINRDEYNMDAYYEHVCSVGSRARCQVKGGFRNRGLSLIWWNTRVALRAAISKGSKS